MIAQRDALLSAGVDLISYKKMKFLPYVRNGTKK